jgi:methionyl-tRNA formyltransferase
VVNIHPALLPSFPGVDAQRQALDYGVKVSGCTVHFVDAGTDTGPIIAQTVVPVLDDDDQHSLAARILPEEHRLYVRAIRLLAEGRVSLRGRRVCIAPLAGVAAVAAVAGVAGATDVADGAQLALAATVTGVSMSPASPEARLRNPE